MVQPLSSAVAELGSFAEEIMRPSSILELIAVIGSVAVAFVSSLVIEFAWVTDLTWFRVLKYSGLFLTAFFGIRFYFISKPKRFEIAKEHWKRNTPIQSHMDVWAEIPKKCHRRGKFPKVEFVKVAHKLNFDDYIVENKEGDLKIFKPTNRFDEQGDDIIVRITV